MEALDLRVKQRRDNYDFYYQNLKDFSGVRFLKEPSERFFSNRWLTTILIDPEKTGISCWDLQTECEKENIETRPLWKPMHMQPVFSSCPSYVNGVSSSLFSQGLCLPSGSNMTDEDRERILDVITKKLKR